MPKRTHIPKAATISGPSCCACGCQSISIIPCDARGEPICEIQFGIEDWTEIFKEMQEVAQAEVLRSMQ
jgi:hypothetical protein